jgi:tetratricopeptide (TPR) repeat protein
MFCDLVGEPRTAIYDCASNAQQMHRLGRRLEEAAATGALAFAYGVHGQFDNAYCAADRAVELASRVDDAPAAAASHFYRGVVRGWRGDLAGARSSFVTALELSGNARDAFLEYLIHGWRGEALCYAGKLAAAGADLRCCLRSGDDLGTSFHRGAFQAALARVLLRQRNLDAALELSREAIARASGKDDAWSRSIALRIRAEVLLAAQSLPAAERAVRGAIEIQDRQECHPDHARSLLALGAILATRGDCAAANAALAAAGRLFDAMGMLINHTAPVPRDVARGSAHA